MGKKRRKKNTLKRSRIHEIVGLLTASLGLFFGLTMYSQGDSAGVVGQFFYPILKGLFGIISLIYCQL